MKVAKGSFYGIIVLELACLLVIFLVSVQGLVISFKYLDVEIVEQILLATSNPFVSLLIGILITAMIQSSSVTTTVVVAMVASGLIHLENAVFMVMGANIGTTVTSTLASLGHVTHKKEFRKAVAAATVHDFFNILTAILILPLEYYSGFLTDLSSELTGACYGPGKEGALISLSIFAPLLSFIKSGLGRYNLWMPLLFLLSLFASLWCISNILKKQLIEASPGRLERYVLGSPIQALLAGSAITGLVQSSSLISSLIVPIVANNRLSLKKAFPFLMGANLGTTLTAILAGALVSNQALSIALSHFLFNLIGILVFFPIPGLRVIPIFIARRLGKATLKNYSVGFLYVILTFFIIPFFLIYASQGDTQIGHVIQENNCPPNARSVYDTGEQALYRLFYRESGHLEKWFDQTSLNENVLVCRKADTIFVNHRPFLLKEVGYQWIDRDRLGDFSIRISDIIKDFELNHSMHFDTCYVYIKEYRLAPHENLSHRLYLVPDAKILVRHEVLNQSGRVLGKSEMICIL